MRLAYAVPASLLRHDGIRRRTAATAAAWRRAGHEVTEILPALPVPDRTDALRLASWERACDAAARAQVDEMVVAGEVDHVHLRLFVPSAAWSRTARKVSVSLEVHALLDRAESARDAYRVVAGWLPSRQLVRAATGAVFVTDEMARRFGAARLGRTAIGNGVELTHVLPAPAHERPRIGMAVGSRGSWHGLDRLARIAAELPDAQLVVLVPPSLAPWASRELGGSRVEVLVSRERSEYLDLLADLDGMLGTLALDRRGLTEAAPLKVRDSVAAGIPVALPYRDTNLAAARDPAVVHLDARDPGSAAAGLRPWIQRLVGARVAPQTRSLVDLVQVERRRLDFLAGLPPHGRTTGRDPGGPRAAR